MIKINGKSFPSPDIGLGFEVVTFVNSGRNAQAETIGQRVGRDQYKIDGLTWSYLDAEIWSALLKEFEKFTVTVEFPDMVRNCWKTLVMYPGNRTAKPAEISRETGLPTLYKDCKVNLTDCGVM